MFHIIFKANSTNRAEIVWPIRLWHWNFRVLLLLFIWTFTKIEFNFILFNSLFLNGFKIFSGKLLVLMIDANTHSCWNARINKVCVISLIWNLLLFCMRLRNCWLFEYLKLMELLSFCFPIHIFLFWNLYFCNNQELL